MVMTERRTRVRRDGGSVAMVQLTVRFPPELYRAVHAAAREEGVPMVEWMQRAAEDRLERQRGRSTPVDAE